MNEIQVFKKRIYLASPTMHGDELKFIKDAWESNWMSTIGENIDECEKFIADKVGVSRAVGLSCGTAAVHMAVKLAAERVYGRPECGKHALEGKKVFCSDMTFDATVNPVVYEGGIPIFIDTERVTWNMDPEALKKAFEMYPDVKIVILAHLYGTPGKVDEIKSICAENNAVLIEDAAESFGASYKGKQAGSFGDLNVLSFNGNKIITGSSGGMLLTNCREDAEKARKWSTQSRENAVWYQHEELGYNYRMSNVVAGVVRGQLPYLEQHIAQKKVIYEKYKEGLSDIPVSMNPINEDACVPNYWLSCLLIDPDAMASEERGCKDYTYKSEPKKSCPMEILDTLHKYNVESRPIWKPMHLQPYYQNNAFVSVDGQDVGQDIYNRGLCLPSDIKMTEEEQETIINIIKSCFE